MLEWLTVPEVKFTNPQGQETRVKLMHIFEAEGETYEVETNGEALDALAYRYLGSEAESLRLMELNAEVLLLAEFDMKRVPRIKVPV